ncbi:hypothetical protein [Motiliproteus sp. MSK22-1]|uniref:hypothetical protein n=1 Tax=Motiliproteus sp. MSK22-1 TaxID=1897630 RepID=UPI000975EA55|nr:hypothetical protein [Motiliproteus sp. MSK22-1]OMH36160.1 hypothetical protein BGP75_10440 [Motiliproteus sp. MSK22-1]
MNNKLCAALLGMGVMFGSFSVSAEDRPMGFFVTSVGMGNGGDLGGLEGADAHCKKLATAVGAGNRDWRAYLSTEAPKKRGVFARQRIGNGPWYNAHGVLIATNATDLHLYNKTITLETALDEAGNRIKGRGDKPNEHDILTGTQEDGTPYFPDDKDHTCNNWTSSNEGSAQLGHHDRHGGGNTSWNSAHASRGCSQEALKKTGGAGKFYCFAAD